MAQVAGKMAFFMLVAIFLAVKNLNAARICEADDKATYSYHGSTNGPSKWPMLFPACDGEMQSPVDIDTSQVKNDRSLKKLRFFGYDSAIQRGEVLNDGHTVMLTPRDTVDRGIIIEGRKYKLLQLHFHWGADNDPGAEHTLNKRRFEMEIHLVHRSSEDKTAVVGVLVTIETHDNNDFWPIVGVLPDVVYKGESTTLRSSLKLNRILPESPASFYSYTGSLTTPMCTEGVAWYVLKKRQTIGWKQLVYFLNIYSVEREDRDSDCLLAPNNRPLQDLNDRVIYSSQ